MSVQITSSLTQLYNGEMKTIFVLAFVLFQQKNDRLKTFFFSQRAAVSWEQQKKIFILY